MRAAEPCLGFISPSIWTCNSYRGAQYAHAQGSDGLFSGSEGEGGWSDGGDRFDQGDGAIDFSAVRRAYQPDAEDTKSRFTEYSMTSSILPRSEKLQLHDDRFEEFYAQYDDEKMGALEEEAEALDEAGAGSKEVDQFQGVFDEFIEKHSNARGVFFGHIPQDEKDRCVGEQCLVPARPTTAAQHATASVVTIVVRRPVVGSGDQASAN